MFVILNDGGPSDVTGRMRAQCVLQQRIKIFDLLSHGIAVAHLQGADFVDSKASIRMFQGFLIY